MLDSQALSFLNIYDFLSALLSSPIMLDLLLIMTLGFLGSFGHCAGMCGPLASVFSLSNQTNVRSWQQQLYFHSLLNLGRIVSYALVGAGIGALGSVLVAGGQLAGIDSILRRGMAILTGILLVWLGLAQIQPGFLPQMPLLHPLLQGNWHDRMGSGMGKLSQSSRWWTPALLGMAWGFIPCGFLYAAQIRAAETGNLWHGAVMMLAFGVGTTPMMLGVGVSTALMSRDRRSQLFRMGGWVTLTIGILLLLRTGEMVDYTGYVALGCLMLALIARPISRVFPPLLRYRRALGVGAFVLSLAHLGHSLDHTFNWTLEAIPYMLPAHQVGIWAGFLALVAILPAALTSCDRLVKGLGKYWRQVHLLSVPALILCAVHCVLIGSNYLGAIEWTTAVKLKVVAMGLLPLMVLLLRSRWAWSLLSLEKFYAPPAQPN